MTDHDSFRWSCGSAGVNEGATVTRFLLICSVLQFVLFFCGFVLGHADFDQLVPCENFAFHLCRNVFGDGIFPDDKVSYSWNFIQDLDVLLELSSVFQNHNFAF